MKEGRVDQKNLQKVMEKIGWKEMQTLYESKKRIKRNGIILFSAGVLLPLLVIGVYLLFDLPSDLPYLLTLFVFSFTISVGLSRYGYSLLLHEVDRVFYPAGGRYKVVKEVTCSECDYIKTIPFETGDYVGKTIEEECGECGEPLRISSIIAEPEYKIETVGMPILPGAEASMNLLDRITLVLYKLFPIPTIVTRLLGTYRKEE